MSNPFNFGNPVSPSQMVGRWDQVELIAHDLINPGGHSHIVIGGRRFGKSSFLESLQDFLLNQIDPKQRGGWYVFPVLINLQRLIRHSPEGVFGLIISTLYRFFDPQHANKTSGNPIDLNLEQTQLYFFVQSKQKECPLDEFSEILDEFVDIFSDSKGFLRLIFLLDEIEVGLDKDWTDIFFSQLRSLIYQGSLRNNIRCVIAGSSRVIDVREQGSPLLNMLNITYLNALEKKDILQIINWANDVPASVAKTVLGHCGGHPFIAQYLMYHLWDIDPSNAIGQSVTRLVNKFIHEREADLEQWRVDIGQAGQLAYWILAGSTKWLTETQVRQRINTPNLKIGHGLTTLCYHGLAVHDSMWSKYRYSGELFKGWFQSNVLPTLDDFGPSITSSRKALIKDISTMPHASNISKKAEPRVNDRVALPKPLRNHAFISYSHKDKRYLQELHNHLVPYVRSEMIDVWDDTLIQPGTKWQEEIEKALQSAKVAVLLVSSDFLASKFISNIELPLLLAANKQEGVIILPVIVRPCIFTNIDLTQIQSVNTPDKSLSKMKPSKRDEMWIKVTELVRDALSKDE